MDSGYEKIAAILSRLPDSPGVYRYLDEKGRLLYVGKAKSLKRRVRSYWRTRPQLRPNPDLGVRIAKMLRECRELDYIVVDSEGDALILENTLIKQLKPKYNILLRDDKTYPYIYIDEAVDYPRFELTRRVVKGKKIRYYGPFPSGGRALLDTLYELYPLVQKKGSLKGKKACLFHQIGRCLAPCEGKISPEDYAVYVEEAKRAIEERSILVEKLRARMSLLAKQERFEEAAAARDRIAAIESLQIHSDMDLARSADYDIFAIEAGEERGVVSRLFIRSGRLSCTSHSFFASLENYDVQEAYRQAIISFYTADMPHTSSLILVAHPLEDTQEIAAAVSERVGRKMQIRYPRRGVGVRLIELASKNGRELLAKRASTAWDDMAKRVALLFSLERIPVRVEVFDNSHMAGEAAVGAMTVYNDGVWEKSSYRRYSLSAADEYRQMREMLERRIADFDKEPPPELWLLDGGKAALDLARRLLDKAGVRLDCLAIAKEKLDGKAHRAKGAAEDIIYHTGGMERLSASDGRLQWLQMLRDEAHRFALSYHRSKKRREDRRISLLQKKGIGPATVKRLLDFFGTFEAIERAGYEEIAQVSSERVAAALKGRDTE
jgi:excinuclease ABC subunit C